MNFVHEALEDGGSVLQAERHTLVLVKTSVSPEGGLLPVFSRNFDLVESFVGVECREVSFTGKLGQNIIDSGNWVLIRLCDLVNFSIVDTKTVLPLLTDQNSR